MPTITPNQIFQVKKYSISIIISIILIIFGYSIFFVFFGQIKSQTTQDGTKIYLPVSKIYLYLSIISFGISIDYQKKFARFRKIVRVINNYLTRLVYRCKSLIL